MKVLMLGNSFTFVNNVDGLIAALTGWQVERVTRGGAFLYQMLDHEDELCAQVNEALNRQKWDYVVLQEQSNTPALRAHLFHPSVQKLCEKIRQNGAKPVLYATWAYREGSGKLASTGMTYDEMDKALYDAYHKAGEENGALVADVGRAYTALRHLIDPYSKEDDYHPSEAGSLLSAHVIARTIEQDWRNQES